ncbi:amidohydrolase family protein [Fusibacillus kribbianus]|uniref:Amidohydrolase family protein n=1 Tax=Fusibacillus kribbianus TaxID=3044208 RepID=A0AAP4B9A8_9FIRM|nr:amidohydrolase family protein [Ruminococcus sp. YH-rum2234]MDI9242401.1 amidohydrolase family protein [Ruminococcus sp. YH-rum2234]
MLDFSHIPVVDAHAHPFVPTREKADYSYAYSMCVHKGFGDFRYLTSYRMALQEYKRLFQLPNDASEIQVVELRNRTAQEDYKSFVKLLYEDAGIEAMISDFGFPITGEGLTADEFKVFEDAAGPVCDIYDMIRIETTCDRYLYRYDMSFEDMINAFDSYVEEHVRTHKTVGIKTVVGYYTGIKWEAVSYEKAKKNFESAYRGKYLPGREDKAFRDYMVYHGLELAEKYRIAFQIHTGVGDPPACDLRLMNPNDLYELLNTGLASKTKIVIVHAGFPYGYEAAFLAANYPGVYTDISSTVSYLGRAVEGEFRKILDVCPHNKIMFGSDGGGYADQSWFAANYFKRVLSEVLQEYVTDGCFTETYANKIGKMILHDNAVRVYQL